MEKLSVPIMAYHAKVGSCTYCMLTENPKLLFLISGIIILVRYQKWCRKGVLFQLSKIIILDISNFRYQKLNISDIKNCYFGYPK